MSKIVRSIKNVANGYSSTQILVRKATSNDPSGPTTYDMEEISAATYNTQTEFLEIMDMLDRRLNDKGKNWRHVAKSLTVLDYLVRFGSEKCVLWSKDNLYIIKTLREFVHYDESNNDQGALIRVKAKELVSLLRDDDRLATERQLARRQHNGRQRQRNRRASDPYDADLQRALEMSRETAEEERNRNNGNSDENDSDLQAALKLSLEEEEMRKRRNQQNDNLLDLDDNHIQPQYYQQVQYAQPTQFFQPQQTMYQQYDMFGNPIQPTAGYYQTNYGQFGQPQMPQFTQAQPQIPQYTGFNSQPAQTEEMKPLKTGSNNPFALQSELDRIPQQSHQPSLNQLSQNEVNQANAFYTQPSQQQPQSQSQFVGKNSNLNETHELNELLASRTGFDTFGNTGSAVVPHQHTKTGTFINSSGTGYNPYANDTQGKSHAGNPFLNTGNGSSSQQGAPSRINAAPTGFGFGNSKDEPSLIDI